MSFARSSKSKVTEVAGMRSLTSTDFLRRCFFCTISLASWGETLTSLSQADLNSKRGLNREDFGRDDFGRDEGSSKAEDDLFSPEKQTADTILEAQTNIRSISSYNIHEIIKL